MKKTMSIMLVLCLLAICANTMAVGETSSQSLQLDTVTFTVDSAVYTDFSFRIDLSVTPRDDDDVALWKNYLYQEGIYEAAMENAQAAYGIDCDVIQATDDRGQSVRLPEVAVSGEGTGKVQRFTISNVGDVSGLPDTVTLEIRCSVYSSRDEIDDSRAMSLRLERVHTDTNVIERDIQATANGVSLHHIKIEHQPVEMTVEFLYAQDGVNQPLTFGVVNPEDEMGRVYFSYWEEYVAEKGGSETRVRGLYKSPKEMPTKIILGCEQAGIAFVIDLASGKVSVHPAELKGNMNVPRQYYEIDYGTEL